MAKGTLSTIIDPKVKLAFTQHCKRKGLKLSHFIEEALIEKLEDEIDYDAYLQRKSEDLIPADKVFNTKKISRRKN